MSSSLSEAAEESGGRDERRRLDSEDVVEVDEKGDSGEETVGVVLAISFTSQAVSEMRKWAAVVDESDRWRVAESMSDWTAVRDEGDVDNERSSPSAAVWPSASANRSMSFCAVASNATEDESAARLLPLPFRALLVDVTGEAALTLGEDNTEAAETLSVDC